jgi:hypothetical protein
MNRAIALAGILATMLFLAPKAGAVEAVKTVPIGAAGTGTAVPISTSTWTAVPATSSLNRRTLVKVRNKVSNNAAIICTASAASPSEAITVGDIEIQPGENPSLELDDNMDLYCVSLHTAAETINVKEYRQ